MNIFRSKPWLRKASLGFGILTLGAGAVLLPACGQSANEEIVEGEDNVTTESLEETSLISESIGEEVTVRSPIVENLDDSGFFMQTQGGAEEVLVLNTSQQAVAVPAEDTPVQVTGRVAEFVIADVEATYGINLNDELYVDYEQQPVLLAETWALAPTPEMLYERSDAYYGQEVAVEGDARIISPDAIALYEDGWVDDVGILAVNAVPELKGGSANLQEGESVTVTGMVQPFDTNALKGEYDLGLSDAEFEEFASRYTSRPVIMVDGIYPSAVDE